MPKVEIETKAPDFRLLDMDGKWVSLQDLTRNRSILLVFNRGFI